MQRVPLTFDFSSTNTTSLYNEWIRVYHSRTGSVGTFTLSLVNDGDVSARADTEQVVKQLILSQCRWSACRVITVNTQHLDDLSDLETVMKAQNKLIAREWHKFTFKGLIMSLYSRIKAQTGTDLSNLVAASWKPCLLDIMYMYNFEGKLMLTELSFQLT